MELLARYARRLLVVHEGQVVADGSPREVFARIDVLDQAGLRCPQVTEVAMRLGRSWPGNQLPLTEDEAITTLRAAVRATNPREVLT
jgi:energy-coupling factor transport system ATP-binding protein